MANIQDNNPWYNLLFKTVLLLHRGAYTTMEYKHLEKVPKSGALIFTPNHSSALMDALAILNVTKRPTVFVARGDLHRNPLANKALRFLKILPIARQRDGLAEVKKNGQTMTESESALLHGLPFGIMPEGAEQTKRSLLPFGKGVCRIALETLRKLPEDQPFHIVPMGIIQGDYFHYRSTLYVEIGDPIDVRTLVEVHKDMRDPELLNLIKEELRASLLAIIPYLDNDEDYEESYDLLLLDNKRCAKALEQEDKGCTPFTLRMHAMRATSRILMRMKQEKNALYLKAIEGTKRFQQNRVSYHVIDQTLMNGTSKGKFFFALFINLLVLPFYLYASVIAAPTLGIVQWVNKKINDKEFDNTVRFSAHLLIYPIIWLLWLVVFLCCFPWTVAVLLGLLAAPSFRIVHDYFYRMRRLRSDFNYLFNAKMKKSKQEVEALVEELMA